ncbi:MAG: twin-arginine translocation signal domain-containing protein [Pirellulales bacterium]
MKQPEEITRRDALKRAAAVSLAGTAASSGTPSPIAAESLDATSSGGGPSPIGRENQKAGTHDWQLTRVRINKGAFRTSLIEGYCSHQSIPAGETLSIFVSTEPARRFTIDVYRMGYYGGTGARHRITLGPLPGKTQPVPEMGPAPARLRECRWHHVLPWSHWSRPLGPDPRVQRMTQNLLRRAVREEMDDFTVLSIHGRSLS